MTLQDSAASLTAPAHALEAANQPVPAHVALAPEAEGLGAIGRAGTNLAIWQRDLPQGLINFLDGLPVSKLPNEVRTVATVQARAAVAGFIAQLWPEPTLGRQLLCHDISNLVEVFARLTGARRVRIALSGQTEAPRVAFAAGDFRLRLETTYRGPALDWLPEDAIDRDLLDTGDDDLICDDLTAVREVSRFHVALMKGERFAGNAGRGLVTRQPDLPGRGADRLMIRLDQDG